MIGFAVLGYGYWGPRLVRALGRARGARIRLIVEPDAAARARAAAEWPEIPTVTDAREAFSARDVDAVAIATPLSTHFELANAALAAGRHVLVEKPMAASADQARRLIDAAARARRVLMVDHTFVYAQAVQKMRELASSGELGRIYYFDSVRVNLGLFHHDANVLWDLAVHDLSIMDYLIPARAATVSATGVSHIPGQLENIAFVSVFFDDPATIGHVHVNWLAPAKVRRTLLGGDRKMIVFDDIDVSEKVKVYDRGVNLSQDPSAVHQMLINYRVGDMWAPNLPIREPLQFVAEHLLECIETGRAPLTDGMAGLRVVKILEAANVSMRSRGVPVEIAGGDA